MLFIHTLILINVVVKTPLMHFAICGDFFFKTSKDLKKVYFGYFDVDIKCVSVGTLYHKDKYCIKLAVPIRERAKKLWKRLLFCNISNSGYSCKNKKVTSTYFSRSAATLGGTLISYSCATESINDVLQSSSDFHETQLSDDTF